MAKALESDSIAGPRRWRWKLLLTAALIAPVLVALAIWAALPWVNATAARRDLAEQVAAYRQQGEPMSAADLNNHLPVPDERNAAIELRRAGQMINEKDAAWSALWDEATAITFPLDPKVARLIEQALADHPGVLPLVAAAMKKPQVDWGVHFQSPIIEMRHPELGHVRRAATFVHFVGLLDHDRGRDDRSVARAREVLFMTRATDQHPTLAGFLTGHGIGTMGAWMAEITAPDLRMGIGDGAALPEQVRGLIADLLEEDFLRQALQRELRCDRASLPDYMQNLPKATRPRTISETLKDYFDTPELLREGVPCMRMVTAFMAQSGAEDWPAAQSIRSPDSEAARHRLNRHPIAAVLLPGLEMAVKCQYRALADRRLAGTALAVRWYAAEHDGKLPAKLDDLVPSYLPAVPKDPMAAVGQRLRYAPGGNAPVLYSVGDDGMDNGGSERPIRTPDPPRPWLTVDRVTHLTRQPRQAAESAPDR